MMGKKKITTRQRAARRYWNDVRAIAKQKNVDVLKGRKFYRGTIDRAGVDRSEMNRDTLLEWAEEVSLSTVIFDDYPEGEYYFSLRENMGRSVSQRVLAVLLDEFSIQAIFRYDDSDGGDDPDGDEEKTIEATLTIPQSEGRTLDEWWSEYYAVGRKWLKGLFGDDSPEGALVVYKIEAYPG
jgi:hypothetical protein